MYECIKVRIRREYSGVKLWNFFISSLTIFILLAPSILDKFQKKTQIVKEVIKIVKKEIKIVKTEIKSFKAYPNFFVCLLRAFCYQIRQAFL